jgi:PhnB protein
MAIVSPLTMGGTASVLQLNIAEADGLWRRALNAGAEARVSSPTRSGARHGQLTDPFGHRSTVAQRLRDVPQQEIVAAAALAFGGG